MLARVKETDTSDVSSQEERAPQARDGEGKPIWICRIFQLQGSSESKSPERARGSFTATAVQQNG